jgi:hypothetical protein
MPLRVLEFDCNDQACPTYEKKQCARPSLYLTDKENYALDALFIALKPTIEESKLKTTGKSRGTQICERMVEGLVGRPPLGYGFVDLVRCSSITTTRHVIPAPTNLSIAAHTLKLICRG